MKKIYVLMIMVAFCCQMQAQTDSLQWIPATVPYSCDFNNYGENQHWILTKTNSYSFNPQNHFTIGTGTSFANNGVDKSLYISNDSLDTYAANSESGYYFAERLLDFGNVPQNCVLELDWKASGYSSGSSVYGGLKVFLRDTADHTPDENPSYSAEYLELALDDTAWRHIRIPLTDVSGLKTLQFCAWGYLNANARLVPAAIDNISITSATCDAPLFTVTPVGTRAVFDWQGDAADTFLIIYRPVFGTDQDVEYEEIGGNTDTISGLLPNTEYIAWMAKICGSDTSAMYLGTHFISGCGAYVAPFEETFSASQHCWTLDPTYSVLFGYIYTTNYVSYTSNPNYFGYFDTAWSVSPVIDVSGLVNPYLKFSRIQSEYNGARKDLELYYRDYEGDEWHYMGTYITPTSSSEWKTDSLAIPSHSATLQLGFFSIQHGQQQLSRISLDDIYVYEGPDCEVVSDVAFAGQSGDTAFIHWVSNNPAGCLVRYRTSPAADWAYTDDLGGYALIEPLSSLTHYEVEVASYCDSLVWLSCDFTSQVVTVNLPYFTDFSDTADRGWQLDNGTCLNHWMIGAPGGYPQMSNALFVTHDGTTAGYNLDNYYTTVVASKLFNMSDISTVNIEFDVLCGGNVTNYRPKDFLKVFFAPSSVEFYSSENALPYANDTAKTYVVNFHDYLNQTGCQNYDYKLNLTQGNVLHISVEMPNLTPNGESQLVFVWRNDYSTYNDVQPGAIITNVHVWQPTCDVVSYMQVNDIVGGHATVTWTPPAVAESFMVEYKEQGNDWNMATTLTADTNFLTLNGLSSETEYDVRVRVNCGNELGDGNWRYISFNTACAIVVTDSTPYVEDFTAIPTCWNLSVNPNHSWQYYSANGVLGHQTHHNSPIGEECPIYSPMMDISAVTYPYLKFSHLQQGDINFHHFDILRVDYRTGVQDPWQTLAVYDSEVSAWKADSIPLPDTLNYVQFAFTAIYNNGTSIRLDDVTVYNGPSCVPLTSVTVVDVTANAAALSWVGHSEGGYIIRYRDISDTAWIYATSADTTFVISNLQDSHTYVAQVSGDCNEPNWLSVQISTPLSAAAMPYFTDFSPMSDRGWLLNNADCTNFWTMGEVDVANQVYGLFVTNNGTTPRYDTTAVTVVTAEKLFDVAGADSILVEFDIRVGGESRYDFIKLFVAPEYMEYPATSTADYNNPDYAKYNYTLNTFNFTPFFHLTTDQTHSAPYTFSSSIGNGFVHIAAKMRNPVANYTTNNRAKVVFLWKSDYMYGVQPGPIITNVSVMNPTCAPVSQLTVSNALSTTADISWTPSSGGETDWQLEYKESSAMTWNQVLVSGIPSYTLTGLTPSTDYEVRVKADCGNDQSMAQTISFTTTPCDLFCPYTFILYDSHGDGWDGNAAVHVIQQGVDIATLVANNHHLQMTPTYDTVQVNLCHNEDITLQWTWGIWWMENGVTVLDPNGNTVYTVSGMWNHDTTLTTFTTNCPLVAPTVVTDSANGITQNVAVLYGHIADAGDLPIVTSGFEWKPLFASDFTVVTSVGDRMVYTLTGLTANTEYIFRAFAITDVATTYGEDVVFTTLEEELSPCPAPTNLHVTDTADNTIAITWTENGDAEQWNIQYRAGNGVMSSDVSNMPSYLITDLQPGTVYQIQVQSVCGSQTSDWTPVVTATTTNTGMEDYSRYIKVYPNPAGDYINVECTMYDERCTISDGRWDGAGVVIYDTYGRLVCTSDGNVDALNRVPTIRINVSGLASGVYFVRVATEMGWVTKPFVKK